MYRNLWCIKYTVQILYSLQKQNDCYERFIYIVYISVRITPKFVNGFCNNFVRKMFIGAENGLYDIFAYVHGR